MTSPIHLSSPERTEAAATPATVVVNPYLKKETADNDEKIACSKRKFISKYPSLGGAVQSISAAERWKRRRTSAIQNDELFLFRDHHGSNGSTTADTRQDVKDGNVKKHKYQSALQLDHDITELSGEGGSGKTQVCLSTIVDCVMRPCRQGGNGDATVDNSTNNTFDSQDNPKHSTNTYQKAIYISTKAGNTLSTAHRLSIMTQSRLSKQLLASSSSSILSTNILQSTLESQTKTILDRIYLISCHNEESLLEFIHDSLPKMLQHNEIGLVVLDDIATLYRFSDPSLYDNFLHTNSNYVRDRSGDLWTISCTLRKLAAMYRVPILVVNQVTAVMSYLETGGGCDGNVPALGLVWSHCVGMRIMLRKGGSVVEERQDGGGKCVCVRYARVLQGVNVPEEDVGFVVEEGGVRLITR